MTEEFLKIIIQRYAAWQELENISPDTLAQRLNEIAPETAAYILYQLSAQKSAETIPYFSPQKTNQILIHSLKKDINWKMKLRVN